MIIQDFLATVTLGPLVLFNQISHSFLKKHGVCVGTYRTCCIYLAGLSVALPNFDPWSQTAERN